MRDEQKDLVFNLRKAEEYGKKAGEATDPRMKAAFRAVVREYLAKARALEPETPRKVVTE